MNKAFTKETDQDEDEPQPSGPPIKGPNYITPEGFARLRAEMEWLIREERPKIVETVAWAASNGDRSENGDYIYGKRRLREIDRRLRFLVKRLEIAQVVDPSLQKGNDQIFFGAYVLMSDDQGHEQRLQIVGIDETNPSMGKISWISPIAKALLKAHEGDHISFLSPSGRREIDILSVSYEEE
ncbi:MAG: transcription elongation factor GreB [Ferrovum sp. 37-45-19]|uniref:transcription elongation factor GreB n=1 Tax=Ferrovum sp. JA12 TaxID=1356299 RepID=UPI00070320D4|nr:transcription elongation factor GreB [Ferrovum sp. JA12]OYV79354.1 MAG: transcription elongation factor GreB [Ferrovum sp. 21-44-67]OYV94007.1 MAG: transcription elongation factor GreB [Ferrovum sp. 37-45-19]OZB34457.1 MAG: transcription elongation factor GreB [Ferrovum sp. 34-44-207]HQT81842.1 transcription elongation factor GreB [Ferrovaceae bacterium]KRH79357.1 transcription elongation factor GreB [Ferrovum sp. JA12]